MINGSSMAFGEAMFGAGFIDTVLQTVACIPMRDSGVAPRMPATWHSRLDRYSRDDQNPTSSPR